MKLTKYYHWNTVPHLGLITCLVAGILGSSCSSTNSVTTNQNPGAILERPETVWVYPFASTPAEQHVSSVLTGQVTSHTRQQTVDHIAEGRMLSNGLTNELVGEIRKMGMPGARANIATKPKMGDLVIVGSLLSFNEGSELKRVVVGFGAGKSTLCTSAETFVVTPLGLSPLGSSAIDSRNKKRPGAAVGLATFIASENPVGLILSGGMKLIGEHSGSSKVQGRAKDTAKELAQGIYKRFQEQGWIE